MQSIMDVFARSMGHHLPRSWPQWLLRSKALFSQLADHLWARKYLWAAGLAVLLSVNHFFTLGINVSQSLPEHVFLVLKREQDLRVGDYVTFRWHGGGPYLAGIKFTKIVKGVPGDVVTVRGRDILINGEFVGRAKFRATTGQSLEIALPGVIPPGHFYVHGLHTDSLDSRYAITGLIKAEKVIGKSIPLF